MESVKEVLMRRDEMSSDDADDLIEEFKVELNRCVEEGSLEEAYELIGDYFGLEPDYLDEFLF
jgi:hypothetical protein